MRETEDGGLTLVADAKPDWWRKGDEMLAGFPRPEQVRRWWGENEVPGSKSARHARHPQDETLEADTYAQSGGGQPNRHRPDATRHPENGDSSGGVAGEKTAVADEVPASENGLGKPKSGGSWSVAGVAGTFESNGKGMCIHDRPGGEGCYLCDPNHPYRLKEGAKT